MNLNEHAIQISQQTGKDRGNCYKALKTLLAKIDNEHIESLSYNSDFSHVILNGVDFFQDARKHWKQKDVHQPIPVKTVEYKAQSVSPVKEAHSSLDAIVVTPEERAFIESMRCVVINDTLATKPVEAREYYIDDVLLAPNGRPYLNEKGRPFESKGIKVEDAPDYCVSEPTTIDTSLCVYTIDGYKQKLISLYLSNGYSQYDAEVSANAQLNAFAVTHDPELTGTYEKISDDSFSFNGKTVRFNEEEHEFQM